MSHIQLIIGTTREGRFSSKVATWAQARLAAHPDLEVEVTDLRDHPLPFFDGAPPARTLRHYASEDVARFARKIDTADGFVVLTGEHNHGYPAVLKNAMDSTFVEWRRKPISFIGWGNVGGARAIEQLREVAIEFEMAPLRHAVHILPEHAVAARTAPEPFDPTLLDALLPKLDLLAGDLAWWSSALADARRRELEHTA